MDFREYQEKAGYTAVYPGQGEMDGFIYATLGLNGEAGEVAEHAKKMLRDDDGVLLPERLDRLRKECGDVLWYLVAVCEEAGFQLEDVAQENIRKLYSRYQNNTIHGEGDDR